MTNPYNDPESLGLEIITRFNLAEPDYSFHFAVIWRDADNHYYVARDSGCSCPSPFEDYNGLDQLFGPFNFHEVIREMEKMVEEFANDKDYANLEFAKAVDALINTRIIL